MDSPVKPMAISGLIGLVLGELLGVVGGLFDSGNEPAPIFSREVLFMIAAVFCGLPGVVVGLVVGLAIWNFSTPPDEKT
jgi:hypothetical protein